MKHETLGTLEIEAKTGCHVAKVGYEDRAIGIRVDADGEPIERAIELAAAVNSRLLAFDTTAKQAAATQLIGDYNDSWREYDEAQGDGTFKTVCNPKLSEVEFMDKLTLNGVNVTGVDGIEFFYDDGKMFAGHSVVVSTLRGIEFSELYATLFG